MELLASGRDADIFAYAPGLVLRRARDGRSLESEARIMTFVTEHGYPAPHIEELRAGGTEIVMERVDGPMMVDVMQRPWKIGPCLRTLADLHDQLHEIVAPDWFRTFPGGGDRVVHLDLHPLNVIMSARGPVVIDWPNTHRGEPLADVANTYALIVCGRIPLPRPVAALLNVLRRPAMDRGFARRYAGTAFDTWVAEMAELKCFDPNMHPDELNRLHALSLEKRTGEKGRKTAPG